MFQQNSSFIHEALDSNYGIAIGEDFNLVLNHGDRGSYVNDLCIHFGLDVYHKYGADCDDCNWIGAVDFVIGAIRFRD